MSISSETSKVSYTGNGATSVYSYTFKIFDEDDLLVTVRNTSTGVATTLTKTTDYTVSGVGSASGGSVTLVDGGQAWLDGDGDLLSTYKIYIRRKPALVQGSDIRNQGPYFPETIEDQFDKIVHQNQSQQDQIDRSMKLPETLLTSDFDPTLPTTIDTANSAIVTNATGDGLSVGPTTDEISNAQGYAVAADASKDLAEEWATKVDGIVDTTDYSSKAWAIGGTDVTETASRGAAKEWAIKTDAPVDTSEYSAKEYAQGTQTRGASGGGSAKDWANYIGGTVDDTEYSAKKYAQDAAQSAIDAAAAASASQWSDVVYVGFGDSPVTVANTDGGKLYAVDCTGGNVVINLPQISTIDLSGAWSVGVKKTDSSANTITVNPNGSETIGGVSSKVVSRAQAGATFIPDADQTPDDWTVLSFGEVPISGDIVGTTDTQDLTNKKFADAISFDQISTPTSPASGDNKLYFKSDDKLYKLNSAGEEVEVGTGAGGSGGKNYFENADFETNTDGVTTYDDSGAYVDGTGGSPASITVSRNATTPLSGTGDLQIAKAATDGSGEGVTITSSTIDRSDRGRNLFFIAEWDGTAANYTDGDLELKAYSTGTDATILPVVPVAGLNEDGTLPKLKTKIVAYTPTNTDTDSTVRVSLHLASDSATASAWNCYLDDIKLSPDSVVSGGIITPWKSETMTIGGTTTAPTKGTTSRDELRWRRVGDSMEIHYDYKQTAAGSAGSGVYLFPIPDGKSLDTTKQAIGAESAQGVVGFGEMRADSGAGAYYRLSVGTYDANNLYLRYEADEGSDAFYEVASANTPLSINYIWFSFRAVIPIANWEASAALSTTEAGLQTVKVKAATSSATHTDDGNWQTVTLTESEDTHNTFASNTFTAPRTGTYSFQGAIVFTANTTGQRGVRLNINSGTDYEFGSIVPNAGSSSLCSVSVAVSIKLTKGDTVSVEAFQNSGDNLTYQDFSSIQINYVPDFTHFSVYGQTELVESKNTTLSAYSITAGQYGDLTSIELTPGEWDIQGQIIYYANGAITTTEIFAGISTTSGNSATGLAIGDNLVGDAAHQTSGYRTTLQVLPYKVIVTTPTTYYLKAQANTSITNLQVVYKISARKVK